MKRLYTFVHSEQIKKVDLTVEDMVYILELLLIQKNSLGLKSVEEELSSYEYQLNQNLRAKLEKHV